LFCTDFGLQKTKEKILKQRKLLLDLTVTGHIAGKDVILNYSLFTLGMQKFFSKLTAELK
jgi:hypothetical protein